MQKIKHMKVKEIMNKDVIAVSSDTSVKEVARILTENKIHGVPVIDEGKKIIGIVTETNFFAKVDGEFYLEKFVESVKGSKLPDVDDLNKESKITADTRAEEIMTKDCVFVDPDMEADDLFKVFRKYGFHTIPVAENGGILCGIVSIADLIAMSTNKFDKK